MRSLRILTRVLALIAFITGVATLAGLHDPLYASAHLGGPAVLDSNLRFFGGIWFTLGVWLLWIASDLETHAAFFRFAWLAIFIGGVGRLISMAVVGLPPWPFVAVTMVEIVGAPVFLYWHATLLRRTS